MDRLRSFLQSKVVPTLTKPRLAESPGYKVKVLNYLFCNICICGNEACIAEGQREGTPPSAEERTGDVAVLLHHEPSAELIHSAPHRQEKPTISWTHTLRLSQVRVLHHQLRRELQLWQFYSIISHQLNSYTTPFTGESNPPSAEKRTEAVAVLLHNQPSAELIHFASHRWE